MTSRHSGGPDRARSGRGGGWALGRLVRSLAARFRESWTDTPVADRRAWLRTVGFGFLAILAFVTALEWAGRRLEAAGALSWEAGLLRGMGEDPLVSFSTAVWIQTLGTDITLVLIVLFFAGLEAWRRQPLRSLTIAASYALLDPVVRLGWMMWGRERPQIIMDGLASPGFASFPSGHTTKSLALYGLLTFLWVRASGSAAERITAVFLLVVIMMFIGYGRLRMGVHWPSDVLGGIVLGGAWLIVLIIALRRADSAGRKFGESAGREFGGRS